MYRNRSGLFAMTNEIIAGPLARNACCRSVGTSPSTTAARYCAAFAGVSGTPAARMTELLGIQIPAPDRAADPPNVGAFSTTTTRRPRLAARSAAVIPAAPAPTTTTSNSSTAAWAVSPDATPRAAPAPIAAAPVST
jgi:hypothetical protein